MPSGVSSKVRTQIRGLKNSKSSNDKSAKKVNNTLKKSVKKNMKAEANEEKAQEMASKNFAKGGFLRGRKKTQESKTQPTYYERDNAIVDSYVKELNNANTKYGGTSRNNEMSKINREYQGMRENLNRGFDLMRTPKLKPIGPKPVSSNKMKRGGKLSKKC
jgi:hypothetical protein